MKIKGIISNKFFVLSARKLLKVILKILKDLI